MTPATGRRADGSPPPSRLKGRAAGRRPAARPLYCPAMAIISFDNVAKSFGGQQLFTGVSFALDARDHAVLVGRNGSGKTTLLRLVAGAEHADSGRIARARGRRIWLHEQTPELTADRPVREYLLEAFGHVLAIERQLRAAEATLSGLGQDSPELGAAMRAYQDLQRRYEHAGGYHYNADLDGVLEGLGLPGAMLDRQLLSLSGGELTRVTLARALLADADLLLLDEPTNHLDLDSVEWLEDYLLAYPKAYVLVTHDRRLLERVGSRVLALEHGVVESIGADFATYLRERDAATDLAARVYQQQQEKVEQLQRYYDRFHAKKDKAKQAKAKLTQMERIKREMKPPPRAAKRLHLGLPQPSPSARVAVEMKAPAVGVGAFAAAAGRGRAPTPAAGALEGRVLVRDVHLVVERGEKVALLGPNGSGKTTLAETIAGLRTLPEGVVVLGHNVRLAYFSQQGRELDERATALESVLPQAGHDEQLARSLLGRFLFTPDDVIKRVSQLSGGERSRLRLLTLLTGDANLLLLDEPTNHLDIDSVEALAAALADYTGTVVLITHDRHLIDAVASRVVEIEDGRLVDHLSVERYWEARAQRAPHDEDAAVRAGAPAAASRREAAPHPAEEARRRRARQRQLEADVLRAEKQLGEIDARLAEPGTYADHAVAAQLAAERSRLERELDRLLTEWETVAE